MSENQEGTAFSGNKRKQIEAAMKSKLGDKNLPEDFLMRFKKFGKWALYVILGLFVITLAADIVVGNYIYGLVNDAASDYHWLSRYSGAISVIAAVVFSFPVLWSMMACAVGAGKVKHVVTLIICVLLVLLGAYNAKYQYFAEGAGDKEICPPLTVNEKIRVESKGVGVKYGKTCIQLTPENAALAYAIEKNGAAPKEFFIFGKELHSLKIMKNGVPTLYRGITLADGTFRLYEGPWFDEDKKGEFTKPVLSIEELRPLHKLVHERAEKEAREIEALEATREGQMAAQEERYQERLKRAEENSFRKYLVTGESYTVPRGKTVTSFASVSFFKDNVLQKVVDEDLFRQGGGRVMARCSNCSNSWVVVRDIVN